MRARPPFWQSLFRNRRNNACCACVVLVTFFVAVTAIWAWLSFWCGQMQEVPGSVLTLAGIVAGLKGWKDHLDDRANPAAPAAPDAK